MLTRLHNRASALDEACLRVLGYPHDHEIQQELLSALEWDGLLHPEHAPHRIRTLLQQVRDHSHELADRIRSGQGDPKSTAQLIVHSIQSLRQSLASLVKVIDRAPEASHLSDRRVIGIRTPATEMDKELSTAAESWEKLARSDPLWAVLSDADKRARQWNVEEFFETGEVLVERVCQRAASAGVQLTFGSAVDFGCGVGRLSRALAHRFTTVVGIDVSETMIAIARDLHRENANLRFLLNKADNLHSCPSASADFVCSHITLQHLRPALAKRYMREFFRIVRPGRHVYFQLPSHLILRPDASVMPPEDCRAELAISSDVAGLGPGSAGRIVVQVRNAGLAAWNAPLFVGNHWRDQQGNVVRYDDGRALLPPLAPAEAANVALTIAAPPVAGVYQLEVDIVQEGVRWFADVGSPTAKAWVKVASNLPTTDRQSLPRSIADNVDLIYSPAPPFEMHGIDLAEVEAIATACGMRLVRCDLHATDWLSHEYIFERVS